MLSITQLRISLYLCTYEYHAIVLRTSGVLKLENGAGCRNRTDDLRITSALLYQLS
jgi:hypothetical protein